ncbi:MAG: leucine-rich repeat domain-containing protein [Tatlockia sp.]|nr:leucine-rich repeat domain-containing protein [Tatlockia sp.]
MKIEDNNLIKVNEDEIEGGYFICPDNIKSINGAFSYCKNLEAIEMPDKIAFIGMYSFRSCINLKNIELPKQVKFIGEQTFLDCFNLKTISLHQKIKYIAPNAFDNCKNIEIIIINSENNIEIQKIRSLLPQFLQTRALSKSEYKYWIMNSREALKNNLIHDLYLHVANSTFPQALTFFKNMDEKAGKNMLENKPILNIRM